MVGNLSPKGCNGWVCYSSCTRLVFNFHLQTGASRLSPYLVKTFRRKVAYHRMTNLLNNYKNG
ncbi:MAG: hypothetical protein LBG58_15125 [Planctomycetaceae bacterium]|nr:hypothetical protein [Planctomycetaceae bacterium]